MAKLGRRIDVAKDDAIIAAARNLFLKHGYAGVSIEAVARLANVSKVTIYKRFDGWEQLFAKMAADESEKMERGIEHLSLSEGSLEDALNGLGIPLMSFLARPDVIAFDHRIASEAEAHPELVDRFLASGPQRLHAALAQMIGGLMTDSKLRTAEPEEVAAHLVGLWRSAIGPEQQFGKAHTYRVEKVSMRVKLATRVFLRAYAPDFTADAQED